MKKFWGGATLNLPEDAETDAKKSSCALEPLLCGGCTKKKRIYSIMNERKRLHPRTSMQVKKGGNSGHQKKMTKKMGTKETLGARGKCILFKK